MHHQEVMERVDKDRNVNIILSALTNQKSYHWILVSKC